MQLFTSGLPSTLTDDGSGNLTFTGRWINARNSGADAPANTMTGTWFTGGTSTTTKPHFLIEPTGTTSSNWNTAGTGWGVNAPIGFTGDLFWCGVNGTSKAKLTAAGAFAVAGLTFDIERIIGPGNAGRLTFDSLNAAILFGTDANYARAGYVNNAAGLIEGFALANNLPLRWSSTANAAHLPDILLYRDAPGALAQRAGPAAQAFRLYNTFTSDTNFERLNIRWASNEAIIDTEAGSGGGTLRGLKIGSASTSLLGFYGATPVARGAAIPDATDLASALTSLNALLARTRAEGRIAT